MRLQLASALVISAGLVCGTPVLAADTAQQSSMKSCAGSWGTMAPADKAKTKYKDYMSTCMKKPAPAMAAPVAAKPAMAAPAPAMKMAAPAASMKATKASAPTGGGQAKCKDGTVVTYKNRSGTCSGHKGVATWM